MRRVFGGGGKVKTGTANYFRPAQQRGAGVTGSAVFSRRSFRRGAERAYAAKKKIKISWVERGLWTPKKNQKGGFDESYEVSRKGEALMPSTTNQGRDA